MMFSPGNVVIRDRCSLWDADAPLLVVSYTYRSSVSYGCYVVTALYLIGRPYVATIFVNAADTNEYRLVIDAGQPSQLSQQ